MNRFELTLKATAEVFNGLSTGAAVPARDVAATIILLPLVLWVIFLLAAPRRTRRAARR
jgi:hypothetical protein